MRLRFTLLTLTLALILAGPAAAGERTTYRCAADYANYTGCAVIKNDIQSWTGPGRLAKSRPLVFAAYQDAGVYWEAQTSIAGGQTGDAIVGGQTWAAGAFLYSMRPTDGRQNYQAVVGFRLDDVDSREGCIESGYLDCAMGPQLETGRDSKHVFTVTSRPFEVRIINAMPVEMKRVDGPYWSNALHVPISDNAARISANNDVGTVGSLRSVNRTAAYAAVYKFQRSEDDPRFNGSSVLISVKTTSDGKRSGACTPVYPPSGSRFACSLAFSGSDKGHLIATLRVYVP
jgi:hypothetical protein